MPLTARLSILSWPCPWWTRRSSRRTTSTRARTTVATSPTSWCGVRWTRRRGGPRERRTSGRLIHRQRIAVRPEAAGPAAALRRLAPRSATHRYSCRLRARSLWRLHRARRRPPDALLPAVRRVPRWSVDHHYRGAARPRRRHGPGATGLPRVPRPAVRLLYARVHHHGDRLSRRPPGSDASGGPRGHLRQPLPLHRLRQHRLRRRARRGAAGGGDVVWVAGRVGGAVRPPGGTGGARPIRRPGFCGQAGRHWDSAMTTKLFGERVPRVEDPRLVTGNGRYLDDLGHDALEAAFVRSPHAHARIVDIDVSDALDVEGLVAIYTYEDLDGRTGEPLPLLIPHPTLTHGRTAHALADREVNHVGEAVVMVVATDRYAAEDAVGLIRVDYDLLPAVVGVEAARTADHLVHEDVPGNVAAVMVQQTGDADAAIDAATHSLELDLAIERSASMPLEGKGVLARWDADDQSLLVHTSTQTSTSVRQAIAAKLEIPVDRVEVVTPDVGGGFGVKIVHPWPEEVLVPWAAVRLNRPVKWTEDRREHFVSSAHERGQLHHVRVGYDDDGRLRGLSVEFWHDNGAYIPYGLIVPIITSTQLLGPYKPGPYRVEFRSLYTNTVIVTPYRGAGRPQACFVMERVMDAIAADLGLDRTVVRERNFIRPEEMPYDHGLLFQDGRPLIYDSGDFPASLAKLKELIGWDDFAACRDAARAEGRRIGIGVACYVEGTGVGPYEGGHIRVETDGTVVVSTGLTSQGQGHQTMLAQIVADELGVPFERIRVTTGDTRRFKYAVGTFASRTAVMSGSAVRGTPRTRREKALTIAAQALEAAVEDLEIVGGQVRVRWSPSSSV